MSEELGPDPVTRFLRWMGAHGPMVPLLGITAFVLAATGLDTYGYPAKQVGMLILAGLLVVAAAILATRPKA